MTYFVLLLVGAAVFAFGFWLFWFFKLRVDRKERSEEKPNTSESNPVNDLLGLNLKLRKAGAGLEVTHKAEEVIDKLKEIFPKLEGHQCVSGEFSWTVNRIATEYLPNKCILPFIKLGVGERSEAQGDVLNSLESLLNELLEIEEMLSDSDKSEFDNKSAFLKAKFNQ